MSREIRTGWRRFPLPSPLSTVSPHTRAYQKDVDAGHLSVFVGIDDEMWHLSISHRHDDLSPGRYPTWDEIREAREQFVPDAATMAMLLPPKAEYVNVHPTTFHLWQVEPDRVGASHIAFNPYDEETE